MSQTKNILTEPLLTVWLRPSTTEPCICCKQVQLLKTPWEHLEMYMCMFVHIDKVQHSTTQHNTTQHNTPYTMKHDIIGQFIICFSCYSFMGSLWPLCLFTPEDLTDTTYKER